MHAYSLLFLLMMAGDAADERQDQSQNQAQTQHQNHTENDALQIAPPAALPAPAAPATLLQPPVQPLVQPPAIPSSDELTNDNRFNNAPASDGPDVIQAVAQTPVNRAGSQTSSRGGTRGGQFGGESMQSGTDQQFSGQFSPNSGGRSQYQLPTGGSAGYQAPPAGSQFSTTNQQQVGSQQQMNVDSRQGGGNSFQFNDSPQSAPAAPNLSRNPSRQQSPSTPSAVTQGASNGQLADEPTPPNESPRYQPVPPSQFSAPRRGQATNHEKQYGQQNPQNSSVQTAQAPTRQSPQQTLVATLLENALTAPSGSALVGKEISLSSALERVADRARQLQVVKRYWVLSLATADYHHAVRERQFLEQLPSPRAAREKSLLRSAVAAAAARERETKVAAVSAQYDLAGAALFSADAPGSAPLTSDAPFAGTYGTKFETLFANRSAPDSIRRIHHTLPHVLELIEARAESVAAAQAACDAQAEAFENGQLDISSLLAAHTRLRDQRLAFLAAVRDYNHTIADYALYVAGPGLDRTLIVRMLIVDKPSSRSVLRDSDQALAREQSVSPAARTGRLQQPTQAAPPLRDVPTEPQKINPALRQFSPRPSANQ